MGVSDGNCQMVAEKMLAKLDQMSGRVFRYSDFNSLSAPTHAPETVLLNF